MMIKAKTPLELADHIERYLLKHVPVKPGQALADATEEQMRWIIDALRRPPVVRSTSQG
jgi:hypothetical protein